MMNVGPVGATSRIFDENIIEGVSGAKGGTARKGLKDSNTSVNLNSNVVASTPKKTNDIMIPSSKSTRKALGDLSSSQVNTRIASTPLTHTSIKPSNNKQSTISKVSKGGNEKTVNVPSFSLNINPATAPKVKESTQIDIQSELYSTRQSKYMDEDPYDFVMRTSSKTKVGLMPIVSSNDDSSSCNTNDFTMYQVKNEEYSCGEISYERCPSSHDLQSLLDA